MFEEHRRAAAATPGNEAAGGHKEIIEVVCHLVGSKYLVTNIVSE